MQEIRRCVAPNGAEIAYAVVGSGPPLVLPAWWVSDLREDWEDPQFREFVELLAQNHTVVRYDRPGVGQSTRSRSTFELDDEVASLRAVVRDVGAAPVAMLAMSCGGPPAVALAAREPELVSHLVLYSTYASGADLSSDDARDALVALVRSTWGTVGSRTFADLFLPDSPTERVVEFARYQRQVSNSDVAADLLQLTYDMDVRSELPELSCPVLVLHRTGDHAIRPRCGRAVAEAIAHADYVELPGTEHAMFDGDTRALVREVERFLLGSSTLEFSSRRLATVLFTDIVDSTTLAQASGDSEWSMRLDEHDRIADALVNHLGGRTVKNTGDGILAVFDLPTQALACARRLHHDLGRHGIRIRAGLHAGEVELRGDDVAGIAVNVAARVMGLASAGDTIVTSVVRELCTGSGYVFRDLPPATLKGVDGDWQVCSLG